MDSNIILDFWFDKGIIFNTKKWFCQSYKYDNFIIENFKSTLDYYNNKKGLENLNSKNNYLAFIILLDQFSRQIYRNTENAFFYDKKIIEFTDIGFELYINDFNDVELLFAFMPYIHTENIIYRHKAKIYINLVKDKLINNPKIYNKILKNFEDHNIIYNNFGRFPKRNDVLNRESTKEEITYLSMRINKYY